MSRLICGAVFAGGAVAVAWGLYQTAESVVTPPSYNESPTHSSTDPDYLAKREANAQQLGEGVLSISMGFSVALGAAVTDAWLTVSRPDGAYPHGM